MKITITAKEINQCTGHLVPMYMALESAFRGEGVESSEKPSQSFLEFINSLSEKKKGPTGSIVRKDNGDVVIKLKPKFVIECVKLSAEDTIEMIKPVMSLLNFTKKRSKAWDKFNKKWSPKSEYEADISDEDIKQFEESLKDFEENLKDFKDDMEQFREDLSNSEYI